MGAFSCESRSSRAKQAAEKLHTEGGGGFNPRIRPTESIRASAPEERELPISPEIPRFSAASKARSLFVVVAARLKPHSFKVLRVLQCAVLAAGVCFSLGVSDAGTRYNVLNHRLMCTCGCAEILGECNHVGCPNSTGELDELRAGVQNNESDEEILNAFVAKYGAIVLAAPTTHGFDLVGWIAPFAVFAAATLGTVLLVRRWKIDPVGAGPG